MTASGEFRKAVSATALAAFAVFGTPAIAGAGLDPHVETLPNGLQIVVIEDHRTPVVTEMVWYKVGGADDTYAKSGLAHYLEHLMFLGTKKFPGSVYSKIVAKNGGVSNAFTSNDVTAYFASVPVRNLPQMLEMEADRMVNIVLTKDNFAKERDVVMEERRQRTDNNPGARFNERLNALTYARYPYATPVVGWMEELSKLDFQDAYAFYKAHYAPNNAILVVAGDVTPEGVRKLADKYFGPLKAVNLPPRLRPEEPAPLGAVRFAMSDKRVRQASVTVRWRAPSEHTGDKTLSPALQVLSQILGGGETSRLYRALVIEQGLATGAGADYSPDELGPTSFDVDVGVQPGKDPAAAEKAALAVVEKVLKDGVTEAELKRVKRSLIAEATYAQDSASGLANIFGMAYALGETKADVQNWAKLIDAVTAEDVKKAATAVLGQRETVTGVLTPEAGS